MLTIYKYPLPNKGEGDFNSVVMPADALLLSVSQDGSGELCVYALVDTSATSTVQITFWVYGTGWKSPTASDLNFLGTVKQDLFIWHVFTNYSKQGIA